jgi:plasmid stabilization system protein ParE
VTWPVRVKSVAEAEFAEAAVWYYRRSVTAADRFVAAVESTLARIGESPEQYPLVHRTVRQALVPSFPYAIYFVKASAECVVLSVHHGKRHPRRWMGRGAG